MTEPLRITSRLSIGMFCSWIACNPSASFVDSKPLLFWSAGAPTLGRPVRWNGGPVWFKQSGNKYNCQDSLEQNYLSADKSYSSEDILLVGSRTVPIIEPKQYSEGSTEVSIPVSTPSGTYYLISCSDDMKNIAEKNEMNNCKASKRKIQVTNDSVPISIPLNYDLQVIQVVTTDVSFPVNSGPANYTNISLNLQDILTNSVTITPVTAPNGITAAALTNMNMYILIGASASTVCQDGLRYGPFLITGDSSSPTVNPPSASAESSSVNIIDSGSFAMQ